MDDELSIGQLAERVGVRTSTLRYYEEMGLLTPTRRVAGRRKYLPSAVGRIALIRLTQQSGFTLREAGVLLRDMDRGRSSAAFRQMANDKIVELEETVKQARQMQKVLREGLACGCVDPRTCERLEKAMVAGQAR